MSKPVLDVAGLTVAFRRREGRLATVVSDVSFSLLAGRLTGLAGESGSGKSTAVLTAMGYRMAGSVVLAGTSRLDGIDLLAASPDALRHHWGRIIAYVAQDASQSLDPLIKIGGQLAEPQRLHLGLTGLELKQRSVQLLEEVGIPDPELALGRYPHQFSGGQQQRIALAIAMSCRPRALVLDEPTTGLDVTTQAQVLGLIRRLVRDTGTAAVMISHDLTVLATVCDELSIMYGGEIVERGSAAGIYASPRHPYSAALIDAVPRVDEALLVVGIPGLPPAEVDTERCSFAPRCRFVESRCHEKHPLLASIEPGRLVRCLRADELGPISSRRLVVDRPEWITQPQSLLQVNDVVCAYPGRRAVNVVAGVSLTVDAGETVALVGESGCGKSTLLRAVAGLHSPRSGTIEFSGKSLAARAVRRPPTVRRQLQIVFQDPHSSLNPRHRIGDILGRPLELFRPDLGRRERTARVGELLEEVRLDRALVDRYPHQLSGGQKQRVALARAFAAEPELILCDEVVSALDVSVQASILELLVGLARLKRTALLFVTHDLAVVHAIADRVYVMRSGAIVEEGEAAEIFGHPREEYTRTLLAAVPRPTTEDRKGNARTSV